MEGDVLGGMGEDGFEGSKEECEVFMNVFCGSRSDCTDTPYSTFGLPDNTKIDSKETGRSDAHNANAKGKSLSYMEHLHYKNKEPRYISPDTADDPSKFGLSEPIHCLIVESFGQNILSSYYLFDNQGGMNGAGNINDAVLHSNCSNQSTGYGQVAMQDDSITFPDSQESFSAGILVAGGSVAPEEAPRTLICTDQIPQEYGILNSGTVDFPTRRDLIRGLQNRLHAQAHRLLLDAGWTIQPRKRSDRTKMAFSFIPPKGPSIDALSRAWRMCGEMLLFHASISEQQENGREWMNVDVFWDDLAEALSPIEKETSDAQNSRSLLHRWEILDPFIAVVWIDRRVGALQKGKTVRAVRSATLILHDRKNTNGSSERMLSAVDPDCKSEMFEDACNQKVLSVQGVQELQKEHRCEQVDWKLCSWGEIHKRSLKSPAGHIGKGLCDPGCLQKTNHSASTCDWKKSSASSKSIFMQRASCSLYTPAFPLDGVTPDSQTLVHGPRPASSQIHESATAGSNCNLLVGNESCKGAKIGQPMRVCDMKEKRFNEGSVEYCKEEAHGVNGSITNVQNNSKNISEIELTEANDKDMEVNLHDVTSMDLFDFCMSYGTDYHFDLFQQEENNIFRWESTPAHTVQTEYLKNQNNNDVKTSKTERAPMSAVAEASLTKKKLVKLTTKEPRQIGKEKKSNLNMPLEDEPRGTLLNGDRTHGVLTHHKSTVSQQKKRSRPKKIPRHHVEPKEPVFTLNDGNIHIEPHSEGGNEVPVPAIDGSPDPQNGEKITKGKKTEVCRENGTKRPRGCRINDDDLLIAAILKKKNFSSGATRFASKVGASQSKALRKLKSKKGSCKLLLRTPGNGGKHSMDARRFILKKKTVLCWLIETGAVSLKDVVQFRNPKNNEVVKDGWVTRDGILCKCCNNILSVSDFKSHAGFKLQKPCLNLFLQCGKSYAVCQLQAWSVEYKAKKGHMRAMEVEELDQNDDTCGICGDDGELICCDNCPSTYHQACLPSQEFPEGSWYCSNCICEICRDVVNRKEVSENLAVIECSQCEHKYHVACIKKQFTCTRELGSGTWFCRESCQEVYLGLRSRVGVLNNMGDGFSWTILRCNHDEQKVHSAQKIAAMAECNTKLAVALTIMEECFLPMVDPRTGTDIIPHALYNWRSNFARLNYQGFYTVVLEKCDELVSVASLRLHGDSVAEMPLIATCSEHRRQGICKRLMNEIEKMLKSFKIKMLVLSAIPNLVDIWTSSFGFKPIEDDDKQQLKNINLMLFPGTSLLKKNLCEIIAQEPGTAFTSSSANTSDSNDLYSRAHQSKTFARFDRIFISENGQQSDESGRIDLDAESLIPVSISAEQVDRQQRDLLSSCENLVLADWHNEHDDIENAESIDIQIRKLHMYDMDQSFSAELAVASQMSVASMPSRNNGYPCVPISTEFLSATGNEDPSQNVSIFIEDSIVDVRNEEERASVQGDNIENEKETLVLRKENNGCSLSGKRIREGPFRAASNVIDKNLGDLDISRILLDSSIFRDEIFASVARHPVAEGINPGNFEG